MRGPCMGCETRFQFCHSSCPKYIEYRKKVKAAAAERKKDVLIGDFFADRARAAKRARNLPRR